MIGLNEMKSRLGDLGSVRGCRNGWEWVIWWDWLKRGC